MAGELAGRVAIVTGGASGIGRATARALAAQGAAVVVVDMDAAGLEDAVSELDGLGARVHGVVADLADVRSVATVVEDAVSELGRVDILVNAAGTSSGAGLLDTTPEVCGPRPGGQPARAVPPDAARRPPHAAQGDGGRIVNVSSGSAFRARRRHRRTGRRRPG